MKECLQTDYKGRFYEDFYRYEVEVNVVISNFGRESKFSISLSLG
jgi:hypothetical protein